MSGSDPKLSGAQWRALEALPVEVGSHGAPRRSTLRVLVSRRLARVRDYSATDRQSLDVPCDVERTPAGDRALLDRTPTTIKVEVVDGYFDLRPDAPPKHVVDAAIDAASWSPCGKSNRGVVAFELEHGRLAGQGANAPVGVECTFDDRCRRVCPKICEHAEAACLRTLEFDRVDLVHVKAIQGTTRHELVPSGPPSCWQCSKAIVQDGRVEGVWLYHEDGWRRYLVAEFHRLTLEFCGLTAPSEATDG